MNGCRCRHGSGRSLAPLGAHGPAFAPSADPRVTSRSLRSPPRHKQTQGGHEAGKLPEKNPGLWSQLCPRPAVAGREVPGPLWTSSHSWGPGTHRHGHSQTTQGKAFVHIPSERGTHQLAVGPVVVRATQRARAGHPQPHPQGCRRRPATKCLVSGQWPSRPPLPEALAACTRPSDPTITPDHAKTPPCHPHPGVHVNQGRGWLARPFALHLELPGSSGLG